MLTPIFEEAAARRVFPGGVIYCARDENVTAHEAFGTTAYDASISCPVTPDTVYDLASVSKLFTLTAFLVAKNEAGIGENEPLWRFLPQFDRPDKRAITLRHLMMHTAGFGFHLQRLFGEPCETWIDRLAVAPLETLPGNTVNYTCTAYFLLARVVEKLCMESADLFILRKILVPLDLRRTSFLPLNHFATAEIAPCETRADAEQAWHGVVHDEAARQWHEQTGGFCGNAGLFSTASDLAAFCQMWLREGAGIVRPADVKQAFTDVLLENAEGAVYRGWGWQRDNQTYTGNLAPPSCFGHQGFTGPTVLINPRTRDVVIVLNNRVYPVRTGPARFVYHRRIANAHFSQFQT